MTNQERINKAAEIIDAALQESRTLNREEKHLAMQWVWEAAFAIIAGAAHNEAQLILHAVLKDYGPRLTGKFLQECVELKQFDEMEKKKLKGAEYLARNVDSELYTDLVQLLSERIMEDEFKPQDGDDELELESFPAKITAWSEGSEVTVAELNTEATADAGDMPWSTDDETPADGSGAADGADDEKSAVGSRTGEAVCAEKSAGAEETGKRARGWRFRKKAGAADGK